MTMATKQAVLVLLVALGALGRPHHLLAQGPRSPIDALITFVEEDVRVVVPPEMRPYELGRLFLRLDARLSESGDLGTVGQGVLEGVPIELVSDTIRWTDMLVTGPGRSAHIRDDGVYVSIGAVEEGAQGALAITFVYYVTIRRPGRASAVCLEERRVVLTPPRGGVAGWEVAEARRLGGC